MSIEEKLKQIDWLKPVEVSNDGVTYFEVDKINLTRKICEFAKDSLYMDFDEVTHIRNTSKVQKVKDMGISFWLLKETKNESPAFYYTVNVPIPETEENAVLLLKLLGVEE